MPILVKWILSLTTQGENTYCPSVNWLSIGLDNDLSQGLNMITEVTMPIWVDQWLYDVHSYPYGIMSHHFLSILNWSVSTNLSKLLFVMHTTKKPPFGTYMVLLNMNKTINKSYESYDVVSPELQHTIAVENWVIVTKPPTGAMFTFESRSCDSWNRFNLLRGHNRSPRD